MTVKEIIIRALKFVGRDEIASKTEINNEDISLEEEHVRNTMLYCLSAVEDELSRYYFPLVYKEMCTQSQGKFLFESLSFRPIKILSVTADGKEIEFKQYTSFLKADAPVITVEYTYSPKETNLSKNACFTDDTVPIKLLAAGAASEFCLINGEMKQAEFWENVYREEIERIRRKKIADVKLPPRRWV